MSIIKGQLRITRMTDRDIAAMNLFFGIRHHRHNISYLIINHNISQEDNTLFGEYGVDGEFIIPSVSRHLQLLEAMPHLYDAVTTQDLEIHEHIMEKSLRQGFTLDVFSSYYSTPAGQCPNLYLNFHIYNHFSDPDYSYLGWNGNEKNNGHLEDTLCYISQILVEMGYSFEEGTMCVSRGNNNYTSVKVEENGLIMTLFHVFNFDMDSVCTTYFDFPDARQVPYVVVLEKDACKAEMFTGDNPTDEFQHEKWVSADHPVLFLGIVYARSEREAIESICKFTNVNPKFATAYEVDV